MLVPRTSCHSAARTRARAEASARLAEASERVVTTPYRIRGASGTWCNAPFADGRSPVPTAYGRGAAGARPVPVCVPPAGADGHRAPVEPATPRVRQARHFARVTPIDRP